jgi:hypothetical protein
MRQRTIEENQEPELSSCANVCASQSIRTQTINTHYRRNQARGMRETWPPTPRLTFARGASDKRAARTIRPTSPRRSGAPS